MADIKQVNSAGGVIYEDGKVLAIKWLSHDSIDFPKGRVDPGETAEETAVREVLEETGYKTEIVRPLGESTYEFDKDGQHFHKTVTHFLLRRINDNEPVTNFQEGEDFENVWLTLDEAEDALTYEDSKEILRKIVASFGPASRWQH